MYLVDNCEVINGGCSHTCIESTQESEMTCSCEGTALVIDPSGNQKQCSKYIDKNLKFSKYWLMFLKKNAPVV